MRIAICEDEEFIQNSIEKNVEKCLEITGMAGKCECFVSAEELLEKGNMPYALYILDVEMKKLSGLELAEHIRTEDRNAVIIFMTNHSEMMQKAFDVQAFQYLVKPIDSDTAHNVIMRALRIIREKRNYIRFTNKLKDISWKEDRNTKCDAANIDISTVFPYEGKLYGFRSLSDGGSELVVSDLDGGDWKSKGMFITAEEIFQGGVVVGNQMFFLKDVVVRPEDHITEMRTDTVMCVLNFDTMELKELRREKGVFSIQFLGGTKDYQIYSVQEDNGIKCYQFDYDEEESKEISLKNRTQSVVKADETGFYYNSGIDYPKEVYKHDLETSENEICISEEEAKAAFGKEYLQLIIWDVREDGILFHLVDEKEGDVFWKESKSGEIKRLYLEENLPKKNSRLNSFMFGTEDGIGFSYLQSLDSDNIEWYGYISWEDLLAGKNNIKTLVETKFTGGGKPLDEEGNVIGE